MSPTNEAGKEIEIEERDGFLEVRFLGSFTLERFKRQQEAAARACKERKQSRLLVDVTRLGAQLSTLDRYELASHAVQVAWDLRVALFVTPSFLDPKKFGILVAQNRGLVVDAFIDRQKAVDWLLASVPGAPAGDRDPAAP
jgi:hypothetical protein